MSQAGMWVAPSEAFKNRDVFAGPTGTFWSRVSEGATRSAAVGWHKAYRFKFSNRKIRAFRSQVPVWQSDKIPVVQVCFDRFAALPSPACFNLLLLLSPLMKKTFTNRIGGLGFVHPARLSGVQNNQALHSRP
jgi:hypothetical protein